MSTQSNYLSLFDYLGKPAGVELGKLVYNESRKLKVRIETRHVENPKYKGTVMLYPKTFLDQYFSDNKVEYNVY